MWCNLLEGKHSNNGQRQTDDGDNYANEGDKGKHCVNYWVDRLAIFLPQTDILQLLLQCSLSFY